MTQRSMVLTKIDTVAAQVNLSARQFGRCLFAVAEKSLQGQEKMLQDVCHYLELKKLANPDAVRLLLHKIKFDETPMFLKGCYGTGPKHTHVAKVFVIREEWLFLAEDVQAPQRPLTVIRGSISPQIRLCQTGTAETIADMLRQTLVVPRHAGAIANQRWNLVESDENKEKAMKILSQDTQSHPLQEPQAQQMLQAHVVCAGHKAHQVSQKIWEQFKGTHQGIVKAMNALKQPGMWQHFLDSLVELVATPGFVKISTAPLCQEATQFRETILQMFSPQIYESGRASIGIRYVSSSLLNGDWRITEFVEHRCIGGCCSSLANSVAKLQAVMPKLLGWLGVRRLETGDWLHWQRHLHFVGFLTFCHGVFKATFLRAFSRRPLHLELEEVDVAGAQGTATEGDNRQGERGSGVETGDLSGMVRIASEWLTSGSESQLYVLRLALSPQVAMIKGLLATTRGSWDLKQVIDNPGSCLSGPSSTFVCQPPPPQCPFSTRLLLHCFKCKSSLPNKRLSPSSIHSFA